MRILSALSRFLLASATSFTLLAPAYAVDMPFYRQLAQNQQSAPDEGDSGDDGNPGHGGNSGPFTLSYVNPFPAAATVGDTIGPAEVQLLEAGGEPPYGSPALTGTLPGGISLGANNGDGTFDFTGTYNAPGLYDFTYDATDNLGANASTGMVEVLVANPLDYADSTYVWRLGVPVSASPSLTGGRAPYSFVQLAGDMPSGVSVGSDGVVSGTPDTTGSGWTMVTASDADGRTENATLSWTVAAD